MAYLTSSSLSPNSFQLRFGHRCRESSSVCLRIRFRPSRRRILLVYAAGATARNGGKDQSWTSINGSTDSCAGWSDPEGGVDGDSQKKGKFRELLGAGLAGVFFAAGVTFASLSLSSRTTGVKQKMEPLSAEQEVLLTSNEQSAKVDQVGNEANEVVPDEVNKCNSECETGVNKDLPSTESREDALESRLDNIHHPENSSMQGLKSNGNGVDAKDEQNGSDVSNITVASALNPISPALSAYDVVAFPSDASSIKGSHSTTFSVTPDPLTGNDVNLGTVGHADLSLSSTVSANHTTGHQEEDLSPEITSNFSSGLKGQLKSQSLTSSHIILDSGDVVETQVSSTEVVETVASISKEQDIEPTDALLLAEASTLNLPVHDAVKAIPTGTISGLDVDPNEASIPPSASIYSAERHKSDESSRSEASSVIGFFDTNGNEPDISTPHETDRSSVFESQLPERSFSYAGIPAPSVVSAALQVPPGKVLVPAVVDQVQSQALAALQVLKVIEADVQPGDLCTRREYARWLVSASSALSRSTISKVYPAMYIENATELAYDDVTPDDPDFSYIQGLAEAGIISSKLSRSDLNGSSTGQEDSFLFSPESPLSRQDLVSWKMALEKRQLPEVDKKYLYKCSGYIDIDNIDPDAWPALVADLSAGEQGITALAFGYTRLFQPSKPVTKAQAAIALATGDAAEVVGEELTRIEAESMAEAVVNAHTALVAEVEKDLNASFENELANEREKIDAVGKLAEEARLELEKLRAEREEENNVIIRGRAAVESEMEVLSRLRCEVEEQLQDLMSNKMEISFERDRINKLRKEAESENQVIVQLQYELEVERKALSMARAWAEEEAKRAREQARALKEARDRWEKHGIKVIVDEDLQDDASTGITWLTAGKQPPVDETINRAENLVEKLKELASEMKIKSSSVIEKIINKIVALISVLKLRASEASKRAAELGRNTFSKASSSIEGLKENASGFSSNIGDTARRAVEDCKGSVEKITQKFKT